MRLSTDDSFTGLDGPVRLEAEGGAAVGRLLAPRRGPHAACPRPWSKSAATATVPGRLRVGWSTSGGRGNWSWKPQRRGSRPGRVRADGRRLGCGHRAGARTAVCHERDGEFSGGRGQEQATEAARNSSGKPSPKTTIMCLPRIRTPKISMCMWWWKWRGRTASSSGSGRPTCKRCGSCSPRKRLRRGLSWTPRLGGLAGSKPICSRAWRLQAWRGGASRPPYRPRWVESRAGAARAVGRLAGRPERGRRASRGGSGSRRLCAIGSRGGRADH